MAEQSGHINYSAADIQRYLQGGMSAKEMHDMERVALQDPFLADAIEGFNEATFEQSNKHLNEITALLQSEKKDAKVMAMPKKGFQWLRVAAMVLLIAGAGGLSWYILFPNNNNGEKNIAQVAVSNESKADTLVVLPKIDTVNLIAANIPSETKKTYSFTDNTSLKKKAILSSSSKPSGEAAAPAIKEDDSIAATIIKDNDEEKQGDLALAPTPKPEELFAKPVLRFAGDTLSSPATIFVQNEFKGRVTDKNNQPVANATVNAGNRRATSTDASGYFVLKAPDSLLNVTVSSVGFVSAQTALKRNTNNNITVAPDNQSLSEVVVTGYATNKKAKSKSEQPDSAFPAGGWKSFQKYVYKQLGKEPDTLSNWTYTNGIEVEFVINDKGIPYNFKVNGTYNDELSAKAINIIKNGPKWIATKKSKKAKVTIPF